MVEQIPETKTAQASGDAPFLLNIGFVMTYKCPIACPHCILKAGPHRHEEMSREDILDWLEQASAYNGGQLLSTCFTGGEPFCDIEKLKEVTTFAASHGMISTVVTNGYWAKSRKCATEILRSLPYLRVIAVSADKHHLSQLPFDYIRNALLAAQEQGLFCFANVCTESEDDPEYRRLIQQLEQIIDNEQISTVITFPVGRARQTIRSTAYDITTIPPQGACTAASTPTVFPDGRVTACMGPVIDIHEPHPLLLGNIKIQSVSEVLDSAELNPILHIIRVWGPGYLINLLKEKGYNEKLPDSFLKGSICDLCYTLMADKNIRKALFDLAKDTELVRKTAYARVYYLNERRMAELMEVSGESVTPDSNLL
jgi:organic radical activating enzyme